MAQPFPYTYYACPCVDTTSSRSSLYTSKRSSQNVTAAAEEEDERTFDPHSPRANFSLYPLEHLLYCTECHEMRCPRCTVEEVQAWYCPSCLFEVPSSTVKSEGNRCGRCNHCPICTGPLSTSSLAPPVDVATAEAKRLDNLKKIEEHRYDFEEAIREGGPFCLSCSYCNWSSLEIGIKFERSNNISGQLARIKNGGQLVTPAKESYEAKQGRQYEEPSARAGQGQEQIKERSQDVAFTDPPDADDLFSSMVGFYRSQLSAISEGGPYGTSYNFDSPSSITRIMNLYSGAKKTKREKPKPMREAYTQDEGFRALDPTTDDRIIERMRTLGYDQTASPSQRSEQPRQNIRFLDEIRPVAPLLRSKRNKRCQTCRTLLSRPETKIQSTRYKIKQLALQHIPKLSIRALAANPSSTTATSSSSRPSTATSVSSSTATASQQAQQPFDYTHLRPLVPTHVLLTLQNPLFDPIRITLATPGTTPGKIGSRVTVLCPQFDVGANTDVWDAALDPGGPGLDPRGPSSSSRTSKQQGGKDGGVGGAGAGGEGALEAGKPWAQGRNWTSVVLEVVPGMAPITGVLEEGEDELEIPVLVRVEWEGKVSGWEHGRGEGVREGVRERERQKEEGMERREEAFWVVLGVGRIVG